MSKDSKNDKLQYFCNQTIDLPEFLNNFKEDEVQSTDGTNVIRVPFGKRLSKKKRPQKNQNIATLILPITSFDNSTPPPYVA